MGLSSLFLRSLSAAAQGSAYLLTHRSWTSRMGTGFRKWSFSRPRRLVTTRPASSSWLQVLHHAEAGHVEALLERAQGLAVLAEQLVEQAPSGRVGQGPEHVVHEPYNT